MSQMPKQPGIPMLFTSGSHYDVGFDIGQTFGDRIKRYWNESFLVNTKLKPFQNTSEGKSYFETNLAVCRDNFPQFIRELEGMADGAGMDFADLFALNNSKEVFNVLCGEAWTPTTEAMGCTDIFINTKQCKIIAHNEDCDPKVKPYGYIVKARIVETGMEEEDFTAFCYPGCLAGTTVAFNRHGMAFTFNGVYAVNVVNGTPPRNFLSRSVIRARSLEHAQTLIKNVDFGVAYGFNLNIMDTKSPDTLWAIEVAPNMVETKFHVHTVHQGDDDVGKPGHYIHTNNYLHMDTPEIPDRHSSLERYQTAQQYPPPKTLENALAILGDSSNESYPVFRTPRDTDQSETIFTAVVDGLTQKMTFYQGNPTADDAFPLMSLSMV